MEPIRHVFIANPAAGKRDQTMPVASRIGEIAKRHGLNYEIFVTKYPKHASKIVDAQCEAYPDQLLRFYACGGDGTLNEVAGAAVQHPNTQVTHYPLGSGNDFIRIFGEEVERFRQLENLITGEALELDYIQTDCGVAVNIFSVGVDARISAGMQKYKRLPLITGSGAYMAAIAEHFIRGLNAPYQVEVNGRRFEGKQALVLAANGRYYGGGFHPAPEADPTDGLMDIVVVHQVARLTAARVIGAYQKGHAPALPQYMTCLRTAEMTITSGNGKPMTVNLDGERAEARQLRVWVPEEKMHFVVPRGTRVQPCADFSGKQPSGADSANTAGLPE